MLRLAVRLLRLLLTLTLLGAGLYLGGPYLLRAVGHSLMTAHLPAKADLVVALSDEPFLSVPEAARIYHEGLAPAIALPNPPRPRGQEDLLRLGIRIPAAQEISLQLLEALRVPRRAFHPFEERAHGARADILSMSRFLAGRSARTLIVVTSKARSTRIYRTAAAEFGPGVRLLMRSNPRDPLDPDHWGKNRQDARQVLHECEALPARWWNDLRGALRGKEATAPAPVAVR